MPKACNLSKGQIVQINDHPFQVVHIDVQTPSARGANTLYKVRLSGVTSGQRLEQTYKGNDFLEEMELERRPCSYLYRDGNFFTFMDMASYEQHTLSEDNLEGQTQWLIDGLDGITALLLNGRIIAVELPATMDLAIVETAPAIKGASATNRNKPATLSNGVTVLVPEYLAEGEIIRVNTQTAKFMSRAKS
ncbi:MAG: elongation factor P-like protein YeiP [Desulfobacterales bacterium]|jgi:elongation factor P|nr:elongation factor P-like protein YeiP [Desulfobacterales bacterium]